MEGSLLRLLERFVSLVRKKEKKKITDRDMPLFTFELCVRERCLELLEPSFIYKKGGDENYREADTEP